MRKFEEEKNPKVENYLVRKLKLKFMGIFFYLSGNFCNPRKFFWFNFYKIDEI